MNDEDRQREHEKQVQEAMLIVFGGAMLFALLIWVILTL